MSKKSGAIKISDVARFAGVSPATVSKVMNNATDVAGETRQRVLEAVQKLDFRPNVVARSLRVKRTLTIGLITDDLEGIFTTSMMRGVEDAASAQGFSVFLCNSYGKAERERQHLEALLDKQVDGVILLSGYRVRERGGPTLPLGTLPVVYLYQYTHDQPVPCVLPDDRGGALIGTRHLLAQGRRRIALINGPAHYEATHLRLAGYREALTQAGIPFDPTLVRVGTWHENSGYQLAHEVLALPEPPDAFFCASDSLAVGVLDALHERGRRIPQEIAVVGFDNRPFAAYQRPPLTSVALPLYDMGKLAGELLMAAVLQTDGAQQAMIHRVPCYLVQRESCGAES